MRVKIKTKRNNKTLSVEKHDLYIQNVNGKLNILLGRTFIACIYKSFMADNRKKNTFWENRPAIKGREGPVEKVAYSVVKYIKNNPLEFLYQLDKHFKSWDRSTEIILTIKGDSIDMVNLSDNTKSCYFTHKYKGTETIELKKPVDIKITTTGTEIHGDKGNTDYKRYISMNYNG